MTRVCNRFNLYSFFVLVTICTIHVLECSAAAKPRINPTKLECESLDENYMHTRHCYLKPKNGFSPAFVHIEMKVKDITDITYKIQISQKNVLTGKYAPMFGEFTGNMCEKLETIQNNQITKLLYEATTSNTNVNHTCPFNHDLIFENYLVKENFFQTIPVPPGDYLFQITLGRNYDWKYKSTIYTTVIPKIF